MVSITTISTPSMTCTISIFESHWTLMCTSQTTLERIYDTSRRYPRIVGACMFNIPILVNMIAWRFVRACHNELTLCWIVRITRPIIEDVVGKLNKIEFMYIVSHLALQHCSSCQLLWTSHRLATSFTTTISAHSKKLKTQFISFWNI